MKYQIHKSYPRIFISSQAPLDAVPLATYSDPEHDEEFPSLPGWKASLYGLEPDDLPDGFMPTAIFYDPMGIDLESTEIATAVFFSDHPISDEELELLGQQIRDDYATGDVNDWVIKHLSRFENRSGIIIWAPY